MTMRKTEQKMCCVLGLTITGVQAEQKTQDTTKHETFAVGGTKWATKGTSPGSSIHRGKFRM